MRPTPAVFGVCCILILTSCVAALPNAPTPEPAPEECSTPDITPVAFETIAQSAPLGDHPEEPLYAVVTNPDGWRRVQGRLPDQAIEAGIQASRGRGAFFIVAFAGVEGSSGYGVTVEDIAMRGSRQLLVTVSHIEPGPDEIVEPARTLPYHLVAVPRAGLQPTGPLRVTFCDTQGDLLHQEDVSLN